MALEPLIGRHHPVALRVRELADPVVRRRGCELVDVQYSEGGGTRSSLLRVYADQPGGISINTLQDLSETLGDLLDAEDPVPRAYQLEVSSPGVDRPLAALSHFEAARGELVMVVTTEKVDGSRKHRGILSGVSPDEVIVQVDGTARTIPLGLIDHAHIIYVFEEVVRPGKPHPAPEQPPKRKPSQANNKQARRPAPASRRSS
ncbi:MAG: ribosome maturation factor RimP [Deltaproteobacteria bacterium]|nr:ribosome maturation factor RimP [Deltaproteobacteria bacterium]